MEIIKLTIPGILPNLNDYIKALNSNRFRGATMKRQAEELIGYCIMDQVKALETLQEVYLEFRWIEPNRKRDPDNVAFAKKFILDALVTHEVIQNDGWKTIQGFRDFFEVDKKNPRIEITITEYKKGGKTK